MSAVQTTNIHSKTIAYRVDGGNKLGMGHLMRARILSDAIRLFNRRVHVMFFVREDRAAAGYLKAQGLPVRMIPVGTAAGREAKIITAFNPDLIILDILNTSSSYIKALRQANCKIISMEDKGSGSRDVDCLINAIVEGLNSKKVVTAKQHKFIGARYKVLDPKYSRTVKKKRSARNIRLMIVMGGSDLREVTLKAAKLAISLQMPLNIDVVLGPAFNAKSDQYKLLKGFEEKRVIRLYEREKDLFKYWQRADVAIINGGGSLYEAARMGVPALAVEMVPHQKLNIQNFVRRGTAVRLGSYASIGSNRSRSIVMRVLEDQKLLNKMKSKGAKLVDGKGSQRVARIINSMIG